MNAAAIRQPARKQRRRPNLREAEDAAPRGSEKQIYSIGHSTRSGTEFIDLLRAHQIAILADIRTIPGSRRNPQFNRAELSEALQRAGIKYTHLPRLGGLRKSIGPQSPNQAWRNASFRGYADYMQVEEFTAGLEELLKLASRGPLAMMCAEAVPWRCHRSLVSDALLARGICVQHITGRGHASPHEMTSFAAVRAAKVTYPLPGVSVKTRQKPRRHAEPVE
jgi:uncharacterized protein (DUF488 family)